MFQLDQPSVLISGMFISLLGTGLFIYGKKQADLLAMLAGVALCIEPMLLSSLGGMWLGAIAIAGGLIAIKRFG